MQTFQIKLNKIGEITALPDSQRLFGFLMSLLDKKDKEDIDAFAKSVLEGDVCCMVSNLMPFGYYPMPKDYIMEKLGKFFPVNQAKIKEFEKSREKIKIEIEEFRERVNTNLEEQKRKEKNIKQIEEEIQKINEFRKTNGKKVASSLEESKEIHRKNKAITKEEVKKLKAEIKEYNKRISTLDLKYNEKSQEIAKLSRKGIYEAIKRIDFIQKKDLEKLLTDIGSLPESESQVFETKKLMDYTYIKRSQNFIQKFHLKSQSEKWPGLPNVAYSLPIISLQKDNRSDGNKENIVSFCFYVSTEKTSILAKKLQQMCKESSFSYSCFLGNKASSGYNEYEVTGVEEIKDRNVLNIKWKNTKQSAESKVYLNLGILLPNESVVDWEKSILEISSSDRKPYEVNDEIRKVISFITAGSVVASMIKGREEPRIGKCIKNQYNPLYQNALIFGNSFLVELEVGI